MRGTWVQHWPDPDEMPHIVPIGDAVAHLTHADCICGPTLTNDGQELVWVHYALDNR